MKHKTAAVVIAIPFIWWIIIFINQLNMELSCQPEDDFCNSGNTVSGDFIWSIMLWVLSMSIITPIVVAIVILWQIIQMRRKTSK